MDFDLARLDVDGPVAVLTMNDPKVMNAVSPPMLSGLMVALIMWKTSQTASDA